MENIVEVGNISIGGDNPLVLIAGTCVIESEESALLHARKLKEITQRIDMPFIFKASYDKANKTIKGAYRGPGLEKGLEILQRVKQEVGVPVTSDVHWCCDVNKVSKVLDLIQIPASLCKQIDLVIAAAKTDKPVNIKKGQFVPAWTIRNIIRKIEETTNNKNILLTERGTFFGYEMMVNDFRSIGIMKSFGYPVAYDASHSSWVPDLFEKEMGCGRDYISTLACAGIAAGANALFLELHEKPNESLSDASTSFSLPKLEELCIKLKKIYGVIR